MTPSELDELERLYNDAINGKRLLDIHQCKVRLLQSIPALLQLARIGVAAVEYYEALIRGTDPNIIQVMKLEQDRRCIDYLASRKGEK